MAIEKPEPFIAMRTYHRYAQYRIKTGRGRESYIDHEESDLIERPHPAADLDIVEWLDETINGEGTVRCLWRIPNSELE